MKDSSSAAIGRMTSWNHFGTVSLQNTLQGVSEPRARQQGLRLTPRREPAAKCHAQPLRRPEAPSSRPAAPRHPAPHSLDDPGDGSAQEGGIEVPQRRQPPLLGRAVQAHVTQQRGRRGPGSRPAQRRRQQQPPQRAAPHRSQPHRRRRAQPPEPGPEPQRPPHAPEGRLRGKGQEKAARRGARRLPPAGKAPHSPFPPAATPQAQNGGRKAGQRIKTGRESVRIWKCLFQVPEQLSCFSEGKEALEKPHTGPRGCGPWLS